MNQKKFLNSIETSSLTEILERRKDKDFRDVTMLYFMYYTGARATETLNIRDVDLNEIDETVLIRGLKGSNDRELPIPSWLFARMISLRAKHTGETRIFPISYPRLDQIWREFRPTKKKLHSLRHTFALALFRKTKDLRLVQVALGHKSITSTMVYASYVYSTEELKRVLL